MKAHLAKLLVLMTIMLIAAAALPMAVADSSTYKCAIYDKTRGVLIDDYDCDDVPDYQDNCPRTYNPFQDDSNENSVGDLCDLHIDSFFLLPSNKVKPGQSFKAVAVVNNMGIDKVNEVRVTFVIPELFIETTELISPLDNGYSQQTEMLFRVPSYVEPGVYDAYLMVTYDRYSFLQASTSLVVSGLDVVKPSVVPQQPEPSRPVTRPREGRSLINVVDYQSARVGSDLVYPVKITNSGEYAKTYSLRAANAASWAKVSFEPSTLVNVEPGETKTVMVEVDPVRGVDPGVRVFNLVIGTGTETESIPIRADLKSGAVRSTSTTQGAPSDDGSKKAILVGIIILVVLIIVIGIVVGSRRENDEFDEDLFDDDEFFKEEDLSDQASEPVAAKRKTAKKKRSRARKKRSGGDDELSYY